MYHGSSTGSFSGWHQREGKSLLFVSCWRSRSIAGGFLFVCFSASKACCCLSAIHIFNLPNISSKHFLSFPQGFCVWCHNYLCLYSPECLILVACHGKTMKLGYMLCKKASTFKYWLSFKNILVILFEDCVIWLLWYGCWAKRANFPYSHHWGGGEESRRLFFLYIQKKKKNRVMGFSDFFIFFWLD